VNRLPFLDWTRGAAVLIMIQCHTFNCFAHPGVRQGGPYVLSQFIGGMAAVLFLFLAGVTFAFQMDRLDRGDAPPGRKIVKMVRRAGYVILLAYLFRLNNSLMDWPHPAWRVLIKVDILNCMGVSMLLLAPLCLCSPRWRLRVAAVAGLTAAVASPLLSMAEWGHVPAFFTNYIVPNRKAFPLFPWGSYLAFGIAAGAVLRRIAADAMDRTLQWAVLAGFGLVIGGQYFSSLPYSLYSKSDFWTDSPALVIIRVGLVLLLLGMAYLWTRYGAGQGWSWMRSMGKTSLLVYWVHVLLVYGWTADRWKARLSIGETLLATILVAGLMVGLSAAKLKWMPGKSRQVLTFAEPPRLRATSSL
jgi:uncharacterized membrane protein